GHPFGATGARILSQAVKELAAMPGGSLAVVSICTDGGEGGVALLESASGPGPARRSLAREEALLDEALEESFPASDPVALDPVGAD
ncbi:MAG TPA: hypothetical protein VFE03_05895, partial [Caulobacteraceae bacterium]|nr:hypothetical protein [Caulobacteraceae bacterium]